MIDVPIPIRTVANQTSHWSFRTEYGKKKLRGCFTPPQRCKRFSRNSVGGSCSCFQVLEKFGSPLLLLPPSSWVIQLVPNERACQRSVRPTRPMHILWEINPIVEEPQASTKKIDRSYVLLLPLVRDQHTESPENVCKSC